MTYINIKMTQTRGYNLGDLLKNNNTTNDLYPCYYCSSILVFDRPYSLKKYDGRFSVLHDKNSVIDVSHGRGLRFVCKKCFDDEDVCLTCEKCQSPYIVDCPECSSHECSHEFPRNLCNECRKK